MKSPTFSMRALMPAGFLLAAGTAFAQVPANDNFAAAVAVTAGVTTAGTNLNATIEAGEPPTHWTMTYTAGAATGRSVWYSYTPAASGLASFSVVARGTGTAAAALQAAAYSGTALNALTRIASASSTAGAAGPPATAGVAAPGNLFGVAAGEPVFIQVTGTNATGAAPFDLLVTSYSRNGTIVLPRYSNWEWLHTTNGFDPTTAATWAATWKNTGDPTDYETAPAVVKFSVPNPAPLGFAAMEGAPGIKTDIGTAAPGPNNNAAYARSTFTLPADTTNLWAEVVADDGAYIYIDDHPGVPVHIAARLADGSTTNDTGFFDYRPQDDVFITGAIPAVAAGPVPGCRAYLPAGFNAERNTKMVFLGGMVGQLSAGSHQIAVSVHQTGNPSSDLGFDLQLIDMGAWPLASDDAGIVFTDVPVAFASQTGPAVPALEHHYAPNAGQADLAWYCVSPPSSFTQGCVVPDGFGGAQNALRFNAATGQRFVTEPVNVDGLPQFTASLRILTNDTNASPGFEAGDGFRVFLESSADGVNFAEGAPPLDIQPQVNGAAAFDPFRTAFVTKMLRVSPNPHKFVRMVITGGVDAANEEYIYFDDIRFSQSMQGEDLSMGRIVLGGASQILFSNSTATPVSSAWRQTSGAGITPPPADLELTVDETTTTLHPAANLATADAGVMESHIVNLAGFTGVSVVASLRAFELSAGSGFETDDTFKIEIIEERAAGETPVNLITGHPADVAPADGVLNGFSGTAAEYDASPGNDEFNAAAANAAANSRGTFQFSYAVPGDVLRLRVKVTGANDSPNEYFFLQHLRITDVTDPDTDADGLSDAWETTHFGNLAQTATADSDGDGQSNAAEFAAGTVPSDGASTLRITAATKTGNLVDLTFASVSGKDYQAQSSPDLTSWGEVGAPVSATGSSTTISGLPAGPPPKHYFRIRLVP